MQASSDQKRVVAKGQSSSDRLLTPANIVTLVRICLVPVFVVAILSPWPAYFGLEASSVVKSWVAAAIFIVLAGTDGLDGYLARSRGEVTDFGKFMDPLADKILVAAALLSLIELGVLPSWPALIILTREFIVSGIRMVAASKGVVIAASWYGKAKTVTQIIAIVLFIIKGSLITDPASVLHDPIYLVSWAVMIVAIILTIVSMLDYFVKARHLLGLAPAKSALGYRVGDEETADAADGELKEKGRLRLASEVIEAANGAGLTVGTAESLTGGLIASSLTAVPGSSAVVKGGIVSYVNEVKHCVLSVPQDVLDSVGAVSEQTACAMAEGAIARLDCDVAVSVTGIAGPGGAEPGKPVGTVWMGVCRKGSSAHATLLHFEGGRQQVRLQTVDAALTSMLDQIISEEVK